MQSTRFSLLFLAVSASLAGRAFAQNDDCSGAISVAQGLNGPYTNVGATTSVPAWPCGAGGSDVWFVYLATGSGPLTADTCTGTSYDTTIELFDGAGGCGALVSLGCNDDFCGLQSSITGTVAIGGTYYIRVGGFGGGTGTFSLNINGPTGVLQATNTTLGNGCIHKFASFYENFASPASFDLGSTAMTMLPNGSGGYVVVNAGAFLPVGSTATPVQLGLGDDTEVSQAFTVGSFPGTTGLTICSNGYVSFATGNGTSFTPTVSALLNGPQTGFYSWHDYNPSIAASGKVKYEESASATVITWDGVWDYGATTSANANTLQFQFYPSGIVTIAWGTMSGLGNGHLVGYSPGGVSSDPGSVDLSVVLPSSIQVEATDLLPLTLTGVTRPITGTSWNLNTTNVPANGAIGVDVFGLTDPGINDLFFLGAPNCGLRASLDVLNAWFVAGSSHGYSLPIPSNPALLALNVYTTSAVFQNPPQNAFGAITSNGIAGMIGDF